MCGGSAPAPTAPPDHYAEERARQEAEKADTLAKAGVARTGAEGSARADATAEATRRGLDPAAYQMLVDREVSRIMGLVPQDEQNPGSYFTNFGKNTFDTEEQSLQNKAVGDVNRVAPTGFDRTRTPDNVADATIEEIIGQQYGTARQGVDAAHARGTLRDSGYNSALLQLDQKKGGARAQFDPIASSVIDQARGAQRNVADTGRQRAAGLQLGQNFDLSGFEGDLGAAETRAEGAIGGQVKSLAPTNLFDIGELLNLGGQAQGGQNSPVISMSREEQQRRGAKRGLGTTGAF